jgi:hypothetical protein
MPSIALFPQKAVSERVEKREAKSQTFDKRLAHQKQRRFQDHPIPVLNPTNRYNSQTSSIPPRPKNI